MRLLRILCSFLIRPELLGLVVMALTFFLLTGDVVPPFPPLP
jgi:hypothetical protein